MSTLWPVLQEHYRYVICRLCSQLVCLLAQANVKRLSKLEFLSKQKDSAYYEICPFPVNYESVMFYSTWWIFTTFHLLRNLGTVPVS